MHRPPRRRPPLARPWLLLVVLVASVAPAGVPSLPGLPSPIAPGRAAAEGLAVTQADGRLGAAEAFRATQPRLATEAGVRWERLTFWWRGLQAVPGAALTPHYLPVSIVDQERARGIEVVGLLVNTPDWAAATPAVGGASVPKNLRLPYNDPQNYWGQFVRQVVAMYRGRIDTWIIWNEPDITPEAPNAAYFAWAGTPADYYQLLKVAALNAREVNPNVRIVSAATTYWTDLKLRRELWFSRFLGEVAADPSAPAHNHYFDIAALNLYATPENLYTVPALYHRLMQERGFDTPLWITETNVIPYDDPVTAGTPLGTPAERRASLNQQADFLLQAIAMGLAAGVEKIEVYKLQDGDGDVLTGQALVRADGSKRPEYYAFQVAAQYFSGFSSASLFTPGDLRQVVFDSPTRRVTVLWDAAPVPMTVQVPVAGVAGGGTALRVLPTGDTFPITASGGGFALNLPGATMHTDLDNPSTYQVGGTPTILVEERSCPCAPVQPATNLSPPTAPPFQPVAARVDGQPGTDA